MLFVAFCVLTGVISCGHGYQNMRRPTVSSSHIPILLGDTMTLTCKGEWSEMDGISVTWYKNGIPLPTTPNQLVKDNEASLTKKNVTRLDNGDYRCQISNNFGEKTSSSDLRVRLQYSALVRSIRFSDNFPRIGTSVKITCSFNDGEPSFNNVYIGKDDFMEKADKVNRALGVASRTVHIGRIEDGGMYHCTVDSTAGKTTKSRNLRVAYKPTVERVILKSTKLEVNKPVELLCNVKTYGYPKGELTWYKDGYKQVITATDIMVDSVNVGRKEAGSTTLKVGNLTKKSLGEYLCEVRNNYGFAYKSYKLRYAALEPESASSTAKKKFFYPARKARLNSKPVFLGVGIGILVMFIFAMVMIFLVKRRLLQDEVHDL